MIILLGWGVMEKGFEKSGERGGRPHERSRLHRHALSGGDTVAAGQMTERCRPAGTGDAGGLVAQRGRHGAAGRVVAASTSQLQCTACKLHEAIALGLVHGLYRSSGHCWEPWINAMISSVWSVTRYGAIYEV
jgi:hypothetical protein